MIMAITRSPTGVSHAPQRFGIPGAGAGTEASRERRGSRRPGGARLPPGGEHADLSPTQGQYRGLTSWWSTSARGVIPAYRDRPTRDLRRHQPPRYPRAHRLREARVVVSTVSEDFLRGTDNLTMLRRIGPSIRGPAYPLAETLDRARPDVRRRRRLRGATARRDGPGL